MALLALDGVSKTFGEVVVANNITFQLDEGESLGIVGPNGAGKTSLFGIISGDLKPERGSVTLDGENILALPPWSRTHAGIGRTYQVPRPFEHLSVFENVVVAAQQGARLRRQAAYDAAYSALTMTGLASLSNRSAATLGLMHRKRLELARALAGRPRVLLLDEIAGGLTDPEVNELTSIVAATPARGHGGHLDRARGARTDLDRVAVDMSRQRRRRRGRRSRRSARLGRGALRVLRRTLDRDGTSGGLVSEALLEVSDLVVYHGQLCAVDDVSLRIEKGEIFAVIGANGAGKSTLLRSIAGLHDTAKVDQSGSTVVTLRDCGRIGVWRSACRSCPRGVASFRR